MEDQIKALKRDLKKETTLAEVATNPEKSDHSLLFGIIIDASEAQKYEEKDNYTVALKIIDPSFNYQQKVKNQNIKFHKFVKVNFYSEDPITLPKVKYIGDIIRLRRFKFVYTKKGALIGIMQKFSNWLIYPGANFKERDIQRDPQKPLMYMRRDQNKNRILLEHEYGRMEDLRKWSANFFAQNSLSYVDWWNNFNQTNDSNQSNQVDLFLKVGQIDPKKKQVIFNDLEGNEYEGVLDQQVDINRLNHIIKLRCVNIVLSSKKNNKKYFKVELTNKSSCIYLPSYSMDYQKFFSRTSSKNTHGLLQIYQWLANFRLQDVEVKNNKITPKKHKKKQFVTTYKKIIDCETKSVKELQEMLQKPAMHKNERFIFKGRIVGFNESNPSKFLKVMQIQSKKFFDFDAIELEQNMDKKYRVFIHLQIQVMDDNCKKPLDIYISTTEGDHHLFETWELIPPSDRIELWSKLNKNELVTFKNNLQQLKKPSNKVKLCVQLMVTNNGKSFFKLVDTIFLPL